MIGFVVAWSLVVFAGLCVYLAVLVATAPPHERGPEDR
jgi:hypothetical protein